jgi:hypothetical protein
VNVQILLGLSAAVEMKPSFVLFVYEVLLQTSGGEP